MPVPTIQAFDNRHPVIVCPSEIRPGDWMEDRGNLRQVEVIDTISVRTGAGMLHVLHFRDQPGVPSLVRGIAEGAPNLAVWRTLPEPDSAADPEATDHAAA
jgi:hypothetical protein